MDAVTTVIAARRELRDRRVRRDADSCRNPVIPAERGARPASLPAHERARVPLGRVSLKPWTRHNQNIYGQMAPLPGQEGHTKRNAGLAPRRQPVSVENMSKRMPRTGLRRGTTSPLPTQLYDNSKP